MLFSELWQPSVPYKVRKSLFCFLMLRIFKIYHVSHFQVYNTVLLTILTMCALHPHDLFFIDGSSYLLILFTHFLPSHSSIVYVGAYRFCFFRFHILYLSFPVWLISLSICPQDPSMLSEMAIFHSLLRLNSILLYMYTAPSLSIDSSVDCWIFCISWLL